MNSGIIEQLKAAQRVSVPLVSIVTPDPAETMKAIAEGVASKRPLLAWDVVEGLKALNEAGKDVRGAVVGEFDATAGNPVELFKLAAKFPEKTTLFVVFAHRWMIDPSVVQAIWNLRDAFKRNKRMAILLSTADALPPEIAGDVVALDEPLPDAARLGDIVRELHASTDVAITEPDVTAAVEAVQGLPAFQAEQVVAMSMRKKGGIDVPALWERKRRQIELTPGLKVQRDAVRYADIGGVDVVKSFLGRILAGRTRPNAVVFIDEIEKFLAGAIGGGGDTSGASQDQLGQLLSYMQDTAASGCIFVGPPGASKSMVAKATGNEAGVPTIQLDLGALKGSLVGQSEQQLRNALKVISSVSNGRSLWIATCNAISELPPELRRRFTLGTFFFDIPDAAERARIWQLYLAKLDLSGTEPGVSDDGWTGAEIRQCVDIAWRLGCSLDEASQFVVPVSKSASDQLDKLRRGAEGRFLSASHPGVYTRDRAAAVATTNKGRAAVDLED